MTNVALPPGSLYSTTGMKSSYGTVRYGTVRYGTVRYGTVLYCTVLYCTVLYCTVLPPGSLYRGGLAPVLFFLLVPCTGGGLAPVLFFLLVPLYRSEV